MEVDELKKLYSWGYDDHGCEDENMIAKLKKDMHIESCLATQAINVTNANNNQCIHMPNLHISRCNALRDEDVQTSCSSTNPTMWLIQQMAGIMPLTNKMCRSLMRMNTNDEDSDEQLKSIKSKSKHMMASDKCNDMCEFTSETYDAFLMEEYQKLFNPEHNEKTNLFSTTQAMKARFIHCMGDAIERNQVWTGEIENSINAFHDRDSGQFSTFCTATAATSYNYIPSFVKRNNDASLINSSGDNVHLNTCFKNEIRWEHVPIYQAFTGCIYSDTNQESVEYVESIMKENGLRKDKLTRGDKSIFHNSVCPPQDIKIYDVKEGIVKQLDDSYVQSHLVLPWIRNRNNLDARTGLGSSMYIISPDEHDKSRNPRINNTGEFFENTSKMHQFASLVVEACSDPKRIEDIWRHVILIWAARFWKPTARFMDNGHGMITALCKKPLHKQSLDKGTSAIVASTSPPETTKPANKPYPEGHRDIIFIQPGLPFMHGPTGAYLAPALDNNLSGVANGQYSKSAEQTDIFILRPNIEHEMLGVIMGRGGTQELGATFWGQTELSCYDDAQHGIWGMSYKYHERVMVTNERNLIRVYDVAFDGYNGGMDQTFVDWNNQVSREKFATQTYDRSTPYHGPSMLVMSLPHSERESRTTWPNPIVFHQSVQGNPSPDAEKVHGSLPNIDEHMVFNHGKTPSLCSDAVQKKYEQYMNRLEMTQWASTDSLDWPAGEACIANESSSSPLAFQGNMRQILPTGAVTETHGSGHL